MSPTQPKTLLAALFLHSKILQTHITFPELKTLRKTALILVTTCLNLTKRSQRTPPPDSQMLMCANDFAFLCAQCLICIYFFHFNALSSSGIPNLIAIVHTMRIKAFHFYYFRELWMLVVRRYESSRNRILVLLLHISSCLHYILCNLVHSQVIMLHIPPHWKYFMTFYDL